MEINERLDKTDLLILQALQHNARLTNKELAAQVHLSPTPVFERWKRMEREGIIQRYVTILDADKLNQGFIVFCQVKLRRLNTDIANDFTERIMQIPEITECYNISGHFDYLLKIHSYNMKQYQQFLLNTLGRIESVASIESTFVMDEIKHDYGINLHIE
ncbi:MAG: Lrp/AsnC family transcriptional regulator [Prevotella sp.]|nr:Lrp/AsnC family transcriptional regulator [Prevotella sp.]MDO5527019.1 Lrp/AsnC family transcriptional regulator [Prevotella sp.]